MENTEKTTAEETAAETTASEESSTNKNNASEELDSYLNVTGAGPWIVALTAAVILAGIAVWLMFGRVQTKITGAGFCENGSICCYFELDDISKLSKGTVVEISSMNVEAAEGTVTEAGTKLYRDYDIPNEILINLSDADWYGTVQISCDLEDGLYTATYTEESSAMASFSK